MILEHIEILHSLNIFSITLRIFLALILGGALGLEREQKQRPAGFRTYMIVCVGSALACITNLYMVEALNASDPARIPAQVISGIGFLGAGTILVTRNNHIKGLTTAAGLWCTAAIGIAVGTGLYSGAVLCTFLIVFSFRMLTFVDKKVTKNNRYKNFYVEYHNPAFIRSLIKYCKTNDISLQDLDIIARDKETGNCATFTLKIPDSSKRLTACDEISNIEGVIILEEI